MSEGGREEEGGRREGWRAGRREGWRNGWIDGLMDGWVDGGGKVLESLRKREGKREKE